MLMNTGKVQGRIAYQKGERNVCPGCGGTQWDVRRMTAECVKCSTALIINQSEARNG